MARHSQKPLSHYFPNQYDDEDAPKRGTFEYAKKWEPLAPRCTGHYRAPLSVGPGKVLATSYRAAVPEHYDGPQPDGGIYLATEWLKRIGMIGTGIITGLRHPTVYIDWPDMTAPHLRYAQLAVEWARERLDKGGAVEIACVGGHGRTGTLTACLAVSYGHKPAEAIEYVRKGVCESCIETKSQKEFIHNFKRMRRE